MIYAFTLSMPNRGSWNGGWSGSKHIYAITRTRNKPLEETNHYYSFGDGWGASVAVKRVDATEARTLRKASAGFCGYDWMVDEIERHGRILTLDERNPKPKPQETIPHCRTTHAGSSTCPGCP